MSNETISSKDEAAAEELVKAIQGHWKVESNNWILDVTFNENKVKIKAKNQSHIMARLRGFATQLLHKAGIKNFRAALETFTDSPDTLKALLRQVKFL